MIGGVVGERVVFDLVKHKVGHDVGDGETQGRGQVEGHDVCVPVLVADVDPLVSRVVLPSQLGPQANSALIQESPEVRLCVEIVLDGIRVVRARHILHR